MNNKADSVPAVHKIKVDVAELQQGMYVCELDRPWLGSPFLLQGFPLNDIDDIQAVQEHCSYVYVDLKRSTTRPAAKRPPPPAGTSSVQQGQSESSGRARSFLARFRSSNTAAQIHSEVSSPLLAAKAAYSETSRVLRNVFDDVRLGASINTPQAKEVIKKCVDQVVENSDAMLMLSNIKNKDNYTAEHSLNVAILSIVLAKHRGMSRAQLEEVGVCGLLHDVGKILTPDHVLKKEGRLTADEFLIMKMHPTQGRDILMNSKDTLGASLDVAHGHHERLDGTGYPRGISEGQVGLYTRIVAVADTFDAITSDRIYDDGRSNIEAFKILQSQGGNHYDAKLVSILINAIGIYPSGTCVVLSNGEVAVVVRSHAKHKLQPKVLVLKNAKMRPVTPRYVDLAAPAATADRGLRIVKTLAADVAGIDTKLFRNTDFLRKIAN